MSRYRGFEGVDIDADVGCEGERIRYVGLREGAIDHTVSTQSGSKERDDKKISHRHM
jgi:hypothetical protein